MRYAIVTLLLAGTLFAQDKGIVPAKTITKSYETTGCDAGYELAIVELGNGKNGTWYSSTTTGSGYTGESFSVCMSDDLVKELRAANSKISSTEPKKDKPGGR